MGDLLGKIFHYDSVKVVPIITLLYMWQNEERNLVLFWFLSLLA